MTEQPRKAPRNDYSDMKEYFSDVFETHVNPWSAAVTFGTRATKETEDNKYQVRMRMPLQQAKALAVMLLRSIRGYEQHTQADIDLPKDILDSLGIPLEDWVRFRSPE
jgi:hypothetical protein